MGDLFLCLLLVLAIAASFSESSAISAVMYFFIPFHLLTESKLLVAHTFKLAVRYFDLPIASTVALYPSITPPH